MRGSGRGDEKRGSSSEGGGVGVAFRTPMAVLTVVTLAVLIGLGAEVARALPIVGGALRIDVTTDRHLAELGIGVEPGGTTTRDTSGRLVLPVTGGDRSADGRAGQVELDGAQIVLRGGGSQVALRNLVFDLTFGRILGGLRWLADDGSVVEEAGIPLFTARSCSLAATSEPCRGRQGEIVSSGIGLDWGGVVTQILADAFFGGVPIVRERDPFGLATLETQVVPEPAAGWLVGLGVAGIAAARRRPLRARRTGETNSRRGERGETDR